MRWTLSLKVVLISSLTFAVGIFAAWRHALDRALPSLIQPVELTWQNAAVFLAVFFVFTYLLVRFARFGGGALRVLLMVALLLGTQYVASSFVLPPWDVVAALLGMVIFWRIKVVAVQNIGMALGIAGVAASVGSGIPPIIAAFILACLALYDILAVYKTHHMVTLAQRMVDSGAFFGFVIPARWRDLFAHTDRVLVQERSMILGSGDVGMPLVLAASAVSTSLWSAIAAAVGAIAGLLVMQWMFMHQRSRAPMAALPPIAAGAVLGYLLAVVAGW